MRAPTNHDITASSAGLSYRASSEQLCRFLTANYVHTKIRSFCPRRSQIQSGSQKRISQWSLHTGAARYKWMRKHRLIGSRRDVHHHNLEGLSEEDFHSACLNTSDSKDVFLSARATWDEMNDQLFHIDGLYPDTNIPYAITFNAMQHTEDHDTIFPLHEDCLQISRRAIDHLKPIPLYGQEISSLSILNTILQSRFRESVKHTKRDDLVARNDLLDLCTATDTNGPRSVIGLSLLGWWGGEYEKFYTDPINVPNITTCVLDLLHDTTAPEVSRPPFPQLSREPSRIEQLPMELLDQISTHLSAYSALSMHRASKMLAAKMPLDNNFWRKSIINRQALPYLWDLDVDELDVRRQEHLGASPNSDATWDWKAVGQLLATKQLPLKSLDSRIVNLPSGLWNRRRIWSIIDATYRHDFAASSAEDRNDSLIAERYRREPVFDWQLEEIMDDLGHYS